MGLRTGFLTVATVGLTAGFSSGAAVVIDPTSATDNSHFGSNDATQTINGSGFSPGDAAAIATGQPVPAPWPTAAGSFDPNYVSAQQGPRDTASTSSTVALIYTLSATPVDIASLHYWEYNGDSTGRDLSSFSIAFSADGVTYSTPQLFTGLPQRSGDNQATAGTDLILNGTAAGVQFARISDMTNYGTPDSFGSFFGIQEVRFVTAVPEPVTLGFLAPLAFLAVRRTRRA